MSINKIAVIGDGGWGTTLAILLHRKGYRVKLWSAFEDYAKIMALQRRNPKFLPDIEIPREIDITASVEAVKGSADLYLIAVPCKYLRDTIKQFAPLEQPIVSAVKGIENSTFERPYEIIRESAKNSKIAVLSGPTIAYEVARSVPTTCVAASDDALFSTDIQKIFSTEAFRIYTSNDIAGVELGGALKNVIAIAAGISDGMGLGDNTKAAILTRGLVEMVRLGVALGAKKETFYGLTGIGDLATTCMSRHSRNRWFGEEIGKGKKLDDIFAETSMVVEGYYTARSAYGLAQKIKVDMPITEQIYKVLYEGQCPNKAVRELMTRSPKSE